jgi:hypothetical protein
VGYSCGAILCIKAEAFDSYRALYWRRGIVIEKKDRDLKPLGS